MEVVRLKFGFQFFADFEIVQQKTQRLLLYLPVVIGRWWRGIAIIIPEHGRFGSVFASVILALASTPAGSPPLYSTIHRRLSNG